MRGRSNDPRPTDGRVVGNRRALLAGETVTRHGGFSRHRRRQHHPGFAQRRPGRRRWTIGRCAAPGRSLSEGHLGVGDTGAIHAIDRHRRAARRRSGTGRRPLASRAPRLVRHSVPPRRERRGLRSPPRWKASTARRSRSSSERRPRARPPTWPSSCGRSSPPAARDINVVGRVDTAGRHRVGGRGSTDPDLDSHASS